MNPWDSEEGGFGEFIIWVVLALVVFGVVMGVAFSQCGGN